MRLCRAVETLLLLDSKVRDQDLDDVVRAVESQKGNVIVVSGQHDGESPRGVGWDGSDPEIQDGLTGSSAVGVRHHDSDSLRSVVRGF